MTKKKKEKRKKGSYRSFASPFIRWSLRFLWDGRKRGGDGRVEPSLRRGENWPSCFFRVSRTRLQVVVVVLREKLLRLVKLCSLRTGTYKYFSYLYRFLRVFRFPVKFSRKVFPSGKCCRGEYRLVVSTICVASQTGKEEQQGERQVVAWKIVFSGIENR